MDGIKDTRTSGESSVRPIIIGKSGGRNVQIDLKTFLKTRALIQAGSGGGKSWLLRRLAEQLFGKVQTFIIDREGEFPSLRERYGYVLAGHEGDTATDIRSARLLAEKLLELRASAIFDLYESFRTKPGNRRAWVRGFLEGVMDAPKKYWRDLVVIVDEAHLFCPQESPKAANMIDREVISGCKDAMVALATAGRKRGYCAIWATQRLAKLDKDASAELMNRFVGQTIEDVDVDRAADLMSVSRHDKATFKKDIKDLEPGHFFGFGRAVAKDRILIRVGPVKTTHPESGSSTYAAAPPPAPEKIRSLLPQLQDLPAEVEQKAKTEGELRQEIRTLKIQLRKKPQQAPTVLPAPAPQVKTVEIPVISKKQEKLVRGMIVRLEKAAGKFSKVSELEGEIRGVMDTLGGSLSDAVEAAENLHKPKPGYLRAIGVSPVRPAPRPPVAAIKPSRQSTSPAGNGNPEVTLDKCPRAILTVLAFEWDSNKREGCEIGKIALLSGYRVSGGFKNSLASLRTQGLMEGGNTGSMIVTRAGLDALGDRREVPPQGDDLGRYWLEHPSFGVCEKKILSVLLNCDATGPPYALTIEELAKATGYAVSGGFKNALSSLRTAGVMIGRNTERMKHADELIG